MAPVKSFGDLVRDARTKALARKPATKVPDRMDLLRDALFRSGAPIDDLRYQLLYAVAGTLIEARKRGGDPCSLRCWGAHAGG